MPADYPEKDALPVTGKGWSGYIIPGHDRAVLSRATDKTNVTVILFAHGGGYARGEARMYVPYVKRWVACAKAAGLGIVFLSVEYPLSGEATHPAQPAASILISPWIDMSLCAYEGGNQAVMSDYFIMANEAVPMLTKAFLGKYAGTDGDANALYRPLDQLRGLNPQLIFVGAAEFALSDSKDWARRCREAGVPWLKSMLSGPTKVDAITGDWLSEYNIGTRALERQSNGKGRYEPGFLHSLRMAMDLYKTYPRKLRIVVNAGGGDPKQLAAEVDGLLTKNGVHRRIAYISGDNILDRVDELSFQPLTPTSGAYDSFRRSYGRILSANAYIGAAGIQTALEEGADIVIAGRCSDASPVIGLCAWWHKWTALDLDPLAGSLVAAHLIECGCYVCGGSFAGFQDMRDKHFNLSFPIAEVRLDGTAVIQKQPDQHGMITVDTVRTQFVYELQGDRYLNPDVVADLPCITMDQMGSNRVEVKGLPPPATLKVAITAEAGYQAEFSVYVTGLDAREKVESFKRMSLKMIDASKLRKLEFHLVGMPSADPKSLNEATATIRVFAQADNPQVLSRGRFLGPLLSNQLQGFPALTPNLDYRTADPKPIVTLYTGLIQCQQIRETCHFLQLSGAEQSVLPRHSLQNVPEQYPTSDAVLPSSDEHYTALENFGPTVKAPLGSIIYGRSGDKGSNVNAGLFLPSSQQTEQTWQWLRSFMTIDRLIALMANDYDPRLRIERCEFPNIQAIHFVVHGLLGTGGFVEFLRARYIDVPRAFLMAKSQLKL
ncbi:hypothetical protein CBER1_01174 [Cercospora berteroae]|uniref:DUF1446 domain-containing protein n=1 Tax=Cercospora berteroae TaxID=357750 RepID=A0A2S6CIN1_9PEZI|nr:hypothetical protein CBER1_01174 [Cercospora berteroae]